MISLSLRHGASVKFVVEQMQKDQDTDFTSFNKVVSRVLKKCIADGEKATDKMCPAADQMVWSIRTGASLVLIAGTLSAAKGERNEISY